MGVSALAWRLSLGHLGPGVRAVGYTADPGGPARGAGEYWEGGQRCVMLWPLPSCSNRGPLWILWRCLSSPRGKDELDSPQRTSLFPLSLLQGKNELDQLQKIFGLVGTPTEEAWPDVTKVRGLGQEPAGSPAGPCESILSPYNLIGRVSCLGTE